jgi:hypothetical protein
MELSGFGRTNDVPFFWQFGITLFHEEHLAQPPTYKDAHPDKQAQYDHDL